MKYIKKSKNVYTGYCYACGGQCVNVCGTQCMKDRTQD